MHIHRLLNYRRGLRYAQLLPNFPPLLPRSWNRCSEFSPVVRDVGPFISLFILQVPGFIHFLHFDILFNQSFIPPDAIISLPRPSFDRSSPHRNKGRVIQDYVNPLREWSEHLRRWYLRIPFLWPGFLWFFFIFFNFIIQAWI